MGGHFELIPTLSSVPLNGKEWNWQWKCVSKQISDLWALFREEESTVSHKVPYIEQRLGFSLLLPSTHSQYNQLFLKGLNIYWTRLYSAWFTYRTDSQMTPNLHFYAWMYVWIWMHNGFALFKNEPQTAQMSRFRETAQISVGSKKSGVTCDTELCGLVKCWLISSRFSYSKTKE